MSEGDDVMYLGRWRKRTDAVVRVLSEPLWSGKRGPKLTLRIEPDRYRAGFLVIATRGSAEARFPGFDDPKTLDLIRAALKL